LHSRRHCRCSTPTRDFVRFGVSQFTHHHVVATKLKRACFHSHFLPPRFDPDSPLGCAGEVSTLAHTPVVDTIPIIPYLVKKKERTKHPKNLRPLQELVAGAKLSISKLAP
jgi:hypothetical protein